MLENSKLSNSLTPKMGPSECAFKSQCQQCFGKGYLVSGGWGYVESQLCSCVADCRRCAGTAKSVSGQFLQGCIGYDPMAMCRLINKAKIPARYANAKIELFANSSPSGLQLQKLSSKWVSEFPNKKRPKGLIISGPVGVGKTYILCAMAFALIKQGISVRFVDFFQLLSDIKANYSDGGSDKKLIEPLVHADVLFIDELGKGRNIEWEQTILDQIVNGRYNRGKVIVSTTNYRHDVVAGQDSPQSSFNRILDDQASFKKSENTGFDSLLSRVGPRIFSRLNEMSEYFTLSGHDHRR